MASNHMLNAEPMAMVDFSHSFCNNNATFDNKKFIKVFGERNCGTNFLVESLNMNTVGVESLVHYRNNFPIRAASRLPFTFSQNVAEFLIDIQRANEFQLNFGWKHSAISPEYLKKSKRFDDTFFICIIRNPYYFINSLYRRPYNIRKFSHKSRIAFIGSGIKLNRRDNLDEKTLPSPVDLWNRKCKSYISSASLDNLIVVRYEDVINDFDGFFQYLASIGVSVKGKIDIPMASTKRDELNFFEYKFKTNNFNPEDVYSRDELEIIRRKLDTELCETLAYQIF